MPSRPGPDLSVVLPTRGRPEKLARCLRALGAQALPTDRFEILVGIDGPDGASADAARRAIAERSLHAAVIECPALGVAGVKNELLPRASGRWLVFLNDDVVPEPNFLGAHLGAQREIAYGSRAGADHPIAGAMVLGDTPWLIAPDDTLFDRLIRETSMVFFYHRMPGSSAFRDAGEAPQPINPFHDWGFRHAWNLNLSVPAQAIRDVGGFARLPCPYGYEDLELAWRLRRASRMPVLFHPEARAWHDHRYTPEEYLLREARLGYAALGFARVAPACSREVFGRDIESGDEIAIARASVERDAAHAATLRESVALLGALPPRLSRAGEGHELPDATQRLLIRALYEHHLPLKRWAWRAGLRCAIDGVSWNDVRLPAASDPEHGRRVAERVGRAAKPAFSACRAG